MSLQVEKLEHNMAKLTIEVSAEEVEKALQAAGRVIRTETDKGLILLLDDRFLQRKYQEMFPREWENWKVCDMRSVDEYMKKFWQT